MIGIITMLLEGCDIETDTKEFISKMVLYGLGFGLGVGLIFFNYSILLSILVITFVFVLFEVFIYFLLLTTMEKRTLAIEEALPDFLSIMASNIRSGLTYDRALLLSARKEFGPLAKQINLAGKETLAGKSFSDALMTMGGRVHSELFAKTIRIIVEGFDSGGNLAELLEATAIDIRKTDAMRKEVSATVLVYQLFMFAAAAFGAPLLYAVGEFLIRIITNMRAKIGTTLVSGDVSLPFFNSTSIISPDMVLMFSILAMVITAFFGSLAAGVISKGKESDGLSYIPVLMAVCFGVFLLVRFALETFLKGVFSF